MCTSNRQMSPRAAPFARRRAISRAPCAHKNPVTPQPCKNKALEAVRNFAREEFALKHRYAFALHTDEPHPHVYMVVKLQSPDPLRAVYEFEIRPNSDPVRISESRTGSILPPERMTATFSPPHRDDNAQASAAGSRPFDDKMAAQCEHANGRSQIRCNLLGSLGMVAGRFGLAAGRSSACSHHYN